MIKVHGSRDCCTKLAGARRRAPDRSQPASQELVPAPNLNQPRPSSLVSPEHNSRRSGVEWNVARINAPQVWAMGYHGQGIVIANADTGVQWDHIALKSHYRGWNGTTVNHAYNWHDATSAHSPTPVDPQFHGTFTMSEMVGDDGQGQPGRRCARRQVDRLPQHGSSTASVRRPNTSSAFDFLMAPYPDRTSRAGKPSHGARHHQQLVGLSGERRLLTNHPAGDRKCGKGSRYLPVDGSRKLWTELLHGQHHAGNLQQRRRRRCHRLL